MSATATPIRAEAGRSGGDVRSDCRVIFEPRDAGGVELELTSRVEFYYGDHIRAQARLVLAELGIEHAYVAIEDMGALPFVLAARLEAAVRRCPGLRPVAAARVLPEPKAGRRPGAGAARNRLRRSRLYLPGNEPKYFINAALHEPDAIILDLEDSVHHAEKDTARILVRNALRAVDFKGCERMVRINQLPLGLEDLKEIIPENPDLILIPKVETPEQVKEVEDAIQNLVIWSSGHLVNGQPGSVATLEGSPNDQITKLPNDQMIWLMPILESALGIENAFAIATASKQNVAMTIGLEDYTADLGVMKTREGNETLYARLRLVNAARAAGLQAIDSVYSDIDDMEGLLAWGKRARGLGFEGMGCLHPMQIAVIHEAFAPAPDEIEKAERIVAAFEEAQARGLGVVSLGSKMIDPPVVQRALNLVKRAKQMGLV
jgi:citrate lyase subunit beta/citryl-CoA lyase